MSGSPDDRLLAQTRSLKRFNSLYSKVIRGIESDLLPELSYAQMRTLYLLAHQPGMTAKQLAAELSLDTGYLSRMLKNLVARKLITRRKASHDARHQPMELTANGRAMFQQVDAVATQRIQTLLSSLTPTRRQRFGHHLRELAKLLDQRGEAAPAFVFRPPKPGDLGWIIHRHGTVIADEFGWDAQFEGMVAEIIGEFSKSFDPARDRCIIAEHDGEIVGSVFLMHGDDPAVARLRLLYVEPQVRGLGLGKKLVARAVRDAQKLGYAKVSLWTNRGLDTARHIYESHGFTLVDEAHHQEFTSSKLDTLGQTWELALG